MEDAAMENGETNKDSEVAPALTAVHPTQNSVAVAVGSDLRVFDLLGGCAVSLVDDSDGSLHKDSIRAIRYGANGKLFVSAGDDKLVKIWSTESWRCISSVCSEKRVSAVAISNDGSYVCFADKFGVVWVVDVDGFNGDQDFVNKKAAPLLSHYCSIITSLEFSPDGRFFLSADRDSKIRVTVFPKKPLDGAHEIQSFPLVIQSEWLFISHLFYDGGRTKYIDNAEVVSCLAFVCTHEFPQGFLVSGSGDSTVRLWDISSGSLLDTCDIREKAGLLESKEIEDRYAAVILIYAPSQIAPLLQRLSKGNLQGIILLSCDLSAQTLYVAKVVSIKGDAFIPTSLGTSFSSELLWMVTGASNLHDSQHPCLSRVKVISGFKERGPDFVQHGPIVLEDDAIPRGEKLLEKLQGGVSFDENYFLTAAEALKTSMSNLLIKKQYSTEKREFRKRGRNDKKIKK
ncbi:tRNA (guanine-N(7)-)-methyltransferase non-catalytic subunit wdr4 [Prunus yedoensis var. nudiflora]|uniref:tRNA (guanine-N(7)-)-methyltransferase non-catalytic subunit n=1 Tax=Prunus yedoensis var. nudiflora TaxID=2094558 RepID=A0A314ZJC4_PRUYE|nr:tRNA (guanine-N(7)-)-methyltransferase non-catalytic subunit wdr4 [Prunus yedoensis var. nudiflora]